MHKSLILSINDDYADYLRDESRTIGEADTISFPQNEEEIKLIIKEMYKKNIPITIQGARTGLVAGAVPTKGHIINFLKMDKVTSMRIDDDDNYYLTVQPGVVLSKLREKIKNKDFDFSNCSNRSKEAYKRFKNDTNYFFSPDPTEATATLGGMVACNASGARSYLYGSVRKHINGLKIILYDGDTVTIKRGDCKAEGRKLKLVTDNNRSIDLTLPSYKMPKTKNASGYYIEDDMDAIDLFIGSDGTLGIIAEIEIKLKKLPEIIWGVNCFFEDEDKVIDFVEEVKKQFKCISAIEFFDKKALEILRKQKESGSGFSKLLDVSKNMEASIYLEIHTDNEDIALEILENIGNVMKQLNSSDMNTWVGRTDEDKDLLLFFRHAVPESVNMVIDKRKKENPEITKLGTDMAVENKDLRYIFKLYKKDLEKHNLEYAIWGHIGDNHLHVNILPKDIKDYEKGKVLYSNWAKKVSELGGAVSAEHGVGKIKTNFLKIMYGEKYINEMIKLKKIFDPKGLLSAGNMFKINEGAK